MNANACASPRPTLAPSEALCRVEKLQRRIARAQLEGRRGKAKALARMLARSHSARVLSVSQMKAASPVDSMERESLLKALARRNAASRDRRMKRLTARAMARLTEIVARPFTRRNDLRAWLNTAQRKEYSYVLTFMIEPLVTKRAPLPYSLDALFAPYGADGLYAAGNEVLFGATEAEFLQSRVLTAIVPRLEEWGFRVSNASILPLDNGVEISASRIWRANGALRAGFSKKARDAFQSTVRSTVRKCFGQSQRALIARLNARMLAWGKGQTAVGTLQDYRALMRYVEARVGHWMKRRYGKKGKGWQRKRCYHDWGGRARFSTASPKKDANALRLLDLVGDIIKAAPTSIEGGSRLC